MKGLQWAWGVRRFGVKRGEREESRERLEFQSGFGVRSQASMLHIRDARIAYLEFCLRLCISKIVAIYNF